MRKSIALFAPVGSIPMSTRICILGATVFASFLLGAASAKAHPHVWIDLQTQVLLNDRGEASGLKVIWKLDEFYTAYVIEDIARDGNRTREKALADIARETQENLAEFDYFVRVRANDEPQTFKVTKPMKAWVDDRNLWMDFTVGFDRPLDLAARSVRYAVSDPTYYIEITYPPDADIESLGLDPIKIVAKSDAANTCGYVVERAEPTFEAMSLAASLDQGRDAPNGLGDLFAEWVRLSCP